MKNTFLPSGTWVRLHGHPEDLARIVRVDDTDPVQPYLVRWLDDEQRFVESWPWVHDVAPRQLTTAEEEQWLLALLSV